MLFFCFLAKKPTKPNQTSRANSEYGTYRNTFIIVLCCALQILHFLQMRVCSNPTLSKSGWHFPHILSWWLAFFSREAFLINVYTLLFLKDIMLNGLQCSINLTFMCIGNPQNHVSCFIVDVHFIVSGWDWTCNVWVVPVVNSCSNDSDVLPSLYCINRSIDWLIGLYTVKCTLFFIPTNNKDYFKKKEPFFNVALKL